MRQKILSSVLMVVFVAGSYVAMATSLARHVNANTRGGGAAIVPGGNVLAAPPAADEANEGALLAQDKAGKAIGACPLEHTDVKTEISGFLARVTLTQRFANPFQEPIEAVYTFPLSQNAAVDQMTMKVGDRTIRGVIKRREEARAVYEAAKAAGQTASLLDQERPNIFTQAVANILPGNRIDVTISYVEVLRYEDGQYRFVFPMVVGPRYIPGAPQGKVGGGMAADTDRVPDASKITPQVAPKGTRAGHDVSIDVDLDAGVPIVNLASTLHEVDVEQKTAASAHVRLKDKDVIPNKDFVLSYAVAGGKIEDALLTHRDENGEGFFTLILQPPARVAEADVTPKELVFVVDTSGSMMGQPIEKAKETIGLALASMHKRDTFNLITFSGDTNILFPEPVPATPANIDAARRFLESRTGSGGTEMMKAIRAALDPSDQSDHIRVVVFATDGYVGNDFDIISEVQKHQNARVFSFGIGNSVNRFLLDKMAEEGRGEVEYVLLGDDGSAAAKRLEERVRSPLLTDVQLDWGGLQVADVYPARIPDVFSAKPVVVTGRYVSGGKGTITLRGNAAGKPFSRDIAVTLPEREPAHDVLAQLWARQRVDDLMKRDYAGAQNGNAREDVREAITEVGLRYNLLTQYTSFVAVEEMVVTDGGVPRKVDVPVEMPEGVSREGVFGDKQGFSNVGLVGGGASFGGVTGMRRASPMRPVMKQTKTRAPASSPSSSTGAGSAGRLEAKDESVEVLADKPADPARAKLDPALATIVDRIQASKGAPFTPTAEEARFVRDGKVEVQVWLSELTPAVRSALERLGFEVIADPKTGKLLIGRLPLAKLDELAKIAAVTYVAPYRS